MDELSLPDKVVALDIELSKSGIAHAFRGAIALAYYAEPRATIDIDINLFVDPGEYESVMDVLGGLGVEGRAGSDEVQRHGQTRTWWGRNPVDLFFAYDPFHGAMKERVRKVDFGQTKIPVLAPEHLLVCKAAFDRPKDWIDIEQMLVGTDLLDEDETMEWLERVLDSGDERVERVKRLWRKNR